ncbi:MAG: acyltransferase [Candidatus Hodarchaeales archaeon]|jgi:acetyltransferase-like isoleucine patch superfamily enzyme
MSVVNDLRIVLYFTLTCIILIISFFPEGWLVYFLITNSDLGLIHYLLSPLYLFLAYSSTVLLFGVVHSQLVVRLTLPFIIKPGIYPRYSSLGRLIAVRIAADGIFKSMLKVYTALPFVWGIILFPQLMRLYGLKVGKNVYITTRTYIETAGLVEIGNNSFIGYNSVVTGHANEGTSIVVSPTKIGQNCMVGTYSIVACGVEFGDNSILGAKSGVIKGQRIPPNEVWIGIPAKKLRDRGEKVKNNRWKDTQENR